MAGGALTPCGEGVYDADAPAESSFSALSVAPYLETPFRRNPMADAQTDFGTRLPQKIAANPDKAKAIGAVFLFKINGDGGGVWTVDCKNEPGVTEGDKGGADCTLELSADDWKTISDNPGAAMNLFFTGKLKVTGNAMLATKLQQILA